MKHEPPKAIYAAVAERIARTVAMSKEGELKAVIRPGNELGEQRTVQPTNWPVDKTARLVGIARAANSDGATRWLVLEYLPILQLQLSAYRDAVAGGASWSNALSSLLAEGPLYYRVANGRTVDAATEQPWNVTERRATQLAIEDWGRRVMRSEPEPSGVLVHGFAGPDGTPMQVAWSTGGGKKTTLAEKRYRLARNLWGLSHAESQALSSWPPKPRPIELDVPSYWMASKAPIRSVQKEASEPEPTGATYDYGLPPPDDYGLPPPPLPPSVGAAERVKKFWRP